MKFVVVGGAGFVGRHVVRRLTCAGAEVITWDRAQPASLFPGETFRAVDVLDAELRAAEARRAGRVDGVAWLAAAIRHRLGVDETAEADLKLMVEAPLALLRALDPPPASFVNISSIQVYGRPLRLPIDEDHPKDPFTAYGVAKLYAEQVLDIAGQARGTQVASLRVAFIYGPGQHGANVLPRFLASLRRGVPPTIFGSGDDIRDDIYVDDVARAVELALIHKARGCFNIATGKPHTLRDVALAVCALGPTGTAPSYQDQPKTWVDRYYRVDRARAAFGFSADTPFAEGLRAMWESEEPR